MSVQTVETRVRNLIAEQLGVPESDIRPESAFIEDLGADSLDIVELVMAIEDTFEIDIPDDQAENIKTVKDAVEYIAALAKAGAAPEAAAAAAGAEPPKA